MLEERFVTYVNGGDLILIARRRCFGKEEEGVAAMANSDRGRVGTVFKGARGGTETTDSTKAIAIGVSL